MAGSIEESWIDGHNGMAMRSGLAEWEMVPTISEDVGVELVPPDHFLSRGHSDAYSRVIVQEFQRRMLTWIHLIAKEIGCPDELYTAKLRSVCSYEMYNTYDIRGHSWDEEDDIPGWEFDDYGSASMVEYDEALLPLWQKLAEILRCAPRKYIPSLRLSNIQLHPVVVDLLAPSLNGKDLKRLDISNPDRGNGRSTSFVSSWMEIPA